MYTDSRYIDTKPSTNLDGVSRDLNGRILPGSRLNPDGRGGFQDRPETRSNGSWKRNETARFKLEQMMQLTESELVKVTKDPLSPLLEKKLAAAIINGTWTTIKEMMDQVYGRKSDVDMSLRNENGTPIIKGFVIPTAPEDFIDETGTKNPKYGRTIPNS